MHKSCQGHRAWSSEGAISQAVENIRWLRVENLTSAVIFLTDDTVRCTLAAESIRDEATTSDVPDTTPPRIRHSERDRRNSDGTLE